MSVVEARIWGNYVSYSLRHTFAAWCLNIKMDFNRLVKLMEQGRKKWSTKSMVNRLRDLKPMPKKILEFFGPDFLAPKGTKEGKNTIATSPVA